VNAEAGGRFRLSVRRGRVPGPGPGAWATPHPGPALKEMPPGPGFQAYQEEAQ
jgi:hypothetical protein